MKLRLMITALLALCLLAGCAAAQTLPGIEVFSPGLVRVSEKLGRGERVAMDAQLSVADMLYVRDVSYLQKMLSGTQFAYTGGGTLQNGGDTLTISREGTELFSAAMTRSGQQAALTMNGETFALDISAQDAWMQSGDALAAMAILERVPLTAVCEMIEGLSAGDMLVGGYAVAAPFTVERTMSDDGTRLTKINISGSIAREGEAPWAVSGFLRQPAGRAPKDTAEITFTQDEDNTLTLTYSSTRKSTVARKDKAGEASVDTSLRADSKIAGYGVTTRLSVRLKNAWTADGENLSEKVTVSATLGHTDRTPGRRMQRLNDMSAKLLCKLTLDTAESGNDVIALKEDTTLSAIFDSNTFLDAGLTGSVLVGGAYEAQPVEAAKAASAQEVQAALERAAVNMAKLIYAQLDEDTIKKLESGL